MSLRGKKVSAFSVFKGKKSMSLTSINKSPTQNDKNKKSASASTTPTRGEQSSISSLLGKMTNSEKRKQKADLKKIKKLLKNGSSKNVSLLPDSVTSSPAAEPGRASTGPGVQLKSLRPKGSMANLRYQLPLKPDPGIPVQSAKRKEFQSPSAASMKDSPHSSGGRKRNLQTTPPLPPRQTRTNSMKSMKNSAVVPPRPKGQNGWDATPITTPRGAARLPPKEETESVPPRPPKRRRLSNGSMGVDPLRASMIGRKRPPNLRQDIQEHTESLPAHPSDTDTGLPYMYDSHQEAARLFECLIHPVKPQKFFSELWEKKPLLVKRHMPSYNDGWFSTAELDRILREERIVFGENLDVTTYTNGQRETHNPPGRAHAPVVWDYYQNGCSVRMLNPQTYSRNVWKLLSILQEYFGCCVGANTYLTPAGTQGFAPHYDDIEAFILQLEGKKHWRLYSPRTEQEMLPKYSSGNFVDTDIGEPILDVTLEAGDLLYFPRGTIHQGETMDDAHSLHITVSCCQMNSWGDLLQRIVPRALDIAFEEDLEFRKSLPRDYLHYMGVAFSDSESPERQSFLRHMEQLMMKLVHHAPVDAGCDQMGKRLLHQSLPPVLTEAEKKCSVFGNGERWDPREFRVRGAVEIEPDTEVKVIRQGVIRLVTEEDKVCVYHNLDNIRIFEKVDPQFIELDSDMAPAVEMLLHRYPGYVKVDDFPLDNVQDRVELAAALYEKGILVTREPLDHMSESSSEDDDEGTQV